MALAAPAPPPLFFDCRAEVNMPSGTCRSLSHGIESIVFKLPSVDFVKYASRRRCERTQEERKKKGDQHVVLLKVKISALPKSIRNSALETDTH